MSYAVPILMIVHPGALGDGLLALPALRTLQRFFPRHHMIWFGHKELGGVYENAHVIHQAYSYEDLNFLVNSKSKEVQHKMIASLVDRCERAIGWMEDSDGTWECWFRNVGIKNLLFRSPHDPSLRHFHMADRYIEILQPWFSTPHTSYPLEQGCVGDESSLVLDRSKRVKQSDCSKGPLIILHPGSGSPHKCAPPDLLVNVIHGFTAARLHFTLCLIGGPADAEAFREAQRLLTQLEPIILTDMDLLSVGRYVAHAQLFIGHDSGLSHLVARLGVPSILLFGPTDPAKWAPRGRHIATMRNPCHCVGKEAFAQCRDKWCLSIPTNTIVAKAKEFLSGNLASSTPSPCLG